MSSGRTDVDIARLTRERDRAIATLAAVRAAVVALVSGPLADIHIALTAAPPTGEATS